MRILKQEVDAVFAGFGWGSSIVAKELTVKPQHRLHHFTAMPAGRGLAFVLVVHLPPERDSHGRQATAGMVDWVLPVAGMPGPAATAFGRPADGAEVPGPAGLCHRLTRASVLSRRHRLIRGSST